MMSDLSLVFCNFPNREKAEEIGREIVELRLAACVNISQPVQSIYRWEGKLCIESEVTAIFKTPSSSLARFQRKIEKLHPYDTPEVVVVAADSVNPSYLQWALAETN